MKIVFVGLLFSIWVSLFAQPTKLILNAPALGVAELHQTKYLASGRTGPTSFEDLEVLGHDIAYYDKEGSLIRTEKKNGRFGEKEIQEYHYNDVGKLAKITSSSNGINKREFSVRYGTKDSLIVESIGNISRKLVYINGVLTYGNEFSPHDNLRYITRAVFRADGTYDHQLLEGIDVAGKVVKQTAVFQLTATEWKEGPKVVSQRFTKLRSTYSQRVEIAYSVLVNDLTSNRVVTIIPDLNTYYLTVKKAVLHEAPGEEQLPNSLNDESLRNRNSASRESVLLPDWKYVDPGNYEGLVTPEGKEILPDGIRVYSRLGGRFFIVCTNEKTYGLIDKEGTYIIPLEMNGMQFQPDGNLEVSRGRNFGVFNAEGEWVIPLSNEHLEVSRYLDIPGYITTGTSQSGFQVLNANYEPVTKKTFDKGSYLAGPGYAIGENSDELTLFTPSGKQVTLKSEYKSVGYLTYHRLGARLADGRYVLIDGEGKELLTYKSEVPGAHDDLVMVYWENGKCGLLSLDGHVLTKPIYDNIEIGWKRSRRRPVKEKYHFVRTGSSGYLSTIGEETIE